MAFRTQKISQMTPKGANLEATDLIEVSTIESGSYVTRSITGQEIIDAAVGNVDWGDIGGTLSNQTDLQNALDAKVPTSRTLTINGVTQDLSADRTFTISTGITIGSTAITSGVVGRVLFEGAGNVVQESSSLFWDTTNNRLGIGTETPTQSLDIFSGNLTLRSSSSPFINIGTGGYPKLSLNNRTAIQEEGPTFMSIGRSYSGIGFYLSNTQVAGFASTGNLLLNTTTDAGFRLDVNGTARVQTTDATVGFRATSTTGQFKLRPYLNTAFGLVAESRNAADSAYLPFTISGSKIQLADGNVLINTTTDAGFRLDVNGTARFTGAVTTPAFTMSSNYLGITSGSGGGIFGATLNQSLYIWNRQISTGSGIIIDDFNGVGAANINLNLINIGGGYGTSGTCVHNTLMISRAINMASGTQTVRGFYYNPTLTNTTGLTTHYAIHTAVGRIRFENLPTSSAGLSAGDIWNDAGTLKIV